MAQYDISHSCGHSEHLELFGKVSERQRRMDWLAAQPCRDCKAQASHERAEQAASTLRDADRLPELLGSVKQIAWASDLRAIKLAAIDAAIVEIDARSDSKASELARMARQLASQQTEATYWIDNRTKSALDLIGSIVRRVGALS